MDNWYIVTADNSSAENLLNMFWGLHDFRIIEVKYSAATDCVDVLFEYDDNELRILLRFEGDVQFYVASVDFEVDYIFNASLRVFDNQLQWISDEINNDEPLNLNNRVSFFQGNVIKWAVVDENGNRIPVSENLLHQCWRIYNCETHEYDEEYHDFTVTPA